MRVCTWGVCVCVCAEGGSSAYEGAAGVSPVAPGINQACLSPDTPVFVAGFPG